MDFQTTIIISFIFGTIGTGYFIYGRKQQKMVPLIIGILLGVFPYFIQDLVLSLIVGTILVLVPLFIRS